MEILCNALAETITLLGVLVILIGVLKSLFKFRRIEMAKASMENKALDLDRLRNDMGAYLLLGLEFSVAADIIFTVLEPSHESLITLGALIVIRTVISFFIGRERDDIHRELKEADQPA